MALTQQSHQMIPLYIVIPPSPLFAAHWSFFIPDLSSGSSESKRHEVPRSGRRIHVTGDRLNGFTLEIIRGYNVSKHKSVSAERQYLVGALSFPEAQTSVSSDLKSAQVPDGAIYKDEDDGGGYVDNSPRDELERVCVEIEAPGPSLNKVGVAGGGLPGGKRVKMEVKDCQWWIRQVVQALVERGMLVRAEGEDREPVERVRSLPMH